MTNRLRGLFPQPEPGPEQLDYFVVVTRSADFAVTREVAEWILRELGSDSPRPWLRFRDLSGSMVSIRTGIVEFVRERTSDQRATDRQLRRRLEEESESRPWEDGD